MKVYLIMLFYLLTPFKSQQWEHILNANYDNQPDSLCLFGWEKLYFILYCVWLVLASRDYAEFSLFSLVILLPVYSFDYICITYLMCLIYLMCCQLLMASKRTYLSGTRQNLIKDRTGYRSSRELLRCWNFKTGLIISFWSKPLESRAAFCQPNMFSARLSPAFYCRSYFLSNLRQRSYCHFHTLSLHKKYPRTLSTPSHNTKLQKLQTQLE